MTDKFIKPEPCPECGWHIGLSIQGPICETCIKAGRQTLTVYDAGGGNSVHGGGGGGGSEHGIGRAYLYGGSVKHTPSEKSDAEQIRELMKAGPLNLETALKFAGFIKDMYWAELGPGGEIGDAVFDVILQAAKDQFNDNKY